MKRLDQLPRVLLFDEATDGAEGGGPPPTGEGVSAVVAELALVLALCQAGDIGLGILLIDRARLK